MQSVAEVSLPAKNNKAEDFYSALLLLDLNILLK